VNNLYLVLLKLFMAMKILNLWLSSIPRSTGVTAIALFVTTLSGLAGLILVININRFVISGSKERKEDKRCREIPEEGCLIPEEDGVTGGTELDIEADSQCKTDVNWVPGILDLKLRISKTQHH
jgi:hypothetical protein